MEGADLRIAEIEAEGMKASDEFKRVWLVFQTEAATHRAAPTEHPDVVTQELDAKEFPEGNAETEDSQDQTEVTAAPGDEPAPTQDEHEVTPAPGDEPSPVQDEHEVSPAPADAPEQGSEFAALVP